MEAPSLPREFYYAIGVLLLANLGVIMTLLTWIFRLGRFVTATELGIKDAKECGVRAHKRNDKIDDQISVIVKHLGGFK